MYVNTVIGDAWLHYLNTLCSKILCAWSRKVLNGFKTLNQGCGVLWIGCGRVYLMVDSCFIIGGLFLLVDRLVAAGAADSIYSRDDAKHKKKQSWSPKV